jgi:4-hydroxy-3-polyprenylbenzoate decarboxylase
MKHSLPLAPRYASLPEFANELEKRGRLKRISQPVFLKHEITEIHRRVIEAEGPALRFEKPIDGSGRVSDMPLLANLFGTKERIEWGFGLESGGLPYLAEKLCNLRDPQPPKNGKDVWNKLPLLKAALAASEAGSPCTLSGDGLARPKDGRDTPPNSRVLAGRAGSSYHLATCNHSRA